MTPLSTTLVTVSLVVWLLAPASAAAQSGSLEAKELASLTVSPDSFDLVMTQAGTLGVTPLKASVERRLGRQLTEDESRRLTALFTRVIKDGLPRSELEEHFADLFARYYSPQELKDLVAFYHTPLGMKALRFASTINEENLLAVQRITAAHERELFERFNAEFAREFRAINRELERKQKQ